jgi:hypothetical protein
MPVAVILSRESLALSWTPIHVTEKGFRFLMNTVYVTVKVFPGRAIAIAVPTSVLVPVAGWFAGQSELAL